MHIILYKQETKCIADAFVSRGNKTTKETHGFQAQGTPKHQDGCTLDKKFAYKHIAPNGAFHGIFSKN